MNQRLVAEFSAMIAAQAPLLIEGVGPISDGPLWVYWQHSKSLLGRWRRTIDDAVSQIDHQLDHQSTTELTKIAADILVAEMLTRVWGAVLVACDERQRVRRSGPIAKSILTAHQQSRASVLRMLVHSTVLPLEELAELDRLRRRVERWTDMLVGPLLIRYGNELATFAFDPHRARDFGESQVNVFFKSVAHPTWNLLMTGLRAAFHHRGAISLSHGDPMQPILKTILTMFPEGAFHSSGATSSLRAARARRSSEQPESPPANSELARRTWRHDLGRAARTGPRHSARPSES